MLSYECSFW